MAEHSLTESKILIDTPKKLDELQKEKATETQRNQPAKGQSLRTVQTAGEESS